MIDPATSQRWLHRLLFCALAAVLVFLLLVPLHTTPVRLPGPDLLICLVFAWVQRRPDYVPPLLLATVLLLADFLLMRPPGLAAALTLLGAEFLRSRHTASSELPFPAEWAFAAVVIVAIALLKWVIGEIFVIPHGSLLSAMIQAVMTIFFYPVIVVLSRSVFGIRRLTLTEQDPRGGSR